LKYAIALAMLAVSLFADATTLEIIQPSAPTTCVVSGTQLVGPCAFMAAMMQKMRAHCLGAREGGCGGCAGETCQVKL
jgi:hypothetical protein